MKINQINSRINKPTKKETTSIPNLNFKAGFKTDSRYFYMQEKIIKRGYENEFKGLLSYLKNIRTKSPMVIYDLHSSFIHIGGGRAKEAINLKSETSPYNNPLGALFQLFDAKSSGFKELLGDNYYLESPESIVQQPSSLFDKYVKPCTFLNGQRQHFQKKLSDEFSCLEYIDKASKVTYQSSFYNFPIPLEKFEVTPFEITKFLYKCSSDKNFSPLIVQELSQNNDWQKNKKFLIDMMGEENFNIWLNDEQFGYKKAYSDFYNKKFDESKNLIDLVKSSPNIAPWAFRKKAKELCQEPILGEVPAGFRNLTEFRDFMALIKNITKSDANLKKVTKKIPSIKNIEHNITINDRNFKVEKLKGGISAKTKYKITPEGGETYIIKFNENDFKGNSWRTTQILENEALRADSPYLNAMVDFYLKENNCPNAPDVKFYDMKSKAIVYKMTKGIPAEIKNVNFNNLYQTKNAKIMNNFSKLGIILNDIQSDNFIKDESGNLILIDSGHAKFYHPFRPMVVGKHISLNNICGREI